MKQIGLLSIFPVILVLSCHTGPGPTELYLTEEPIAPVMEIRPGEHAPVSEAAFDPGQITAERYEATMAELREFIGQLNAIIRARNYEAWVSYLSESFYATINSGEFLSRRTEDLFRLDQIRASNAGRNPRFVQKRVLSNSRDYFYNVVVPARSNDRLDDITFVSEYRVIAHTVDSRGNRLILYELAVIGSRWVIIN